MTRYVTHREPVDVLAAELNAELAKIQREPVVPVEEVSFKAVDGAHRNRVDVLAAELNAELAKMDPPAKFIVVTADTEL